MGEVIHSRLQQGLKHNPLWHTIRQRQVTSGYLQMVSGVVPEVSRYALRITMSQVKPPQANQMERIPGSDPVVLFNGSPSWFSESWVRVRLTLTDSADDGLV